MMKEATENVQQGTHRADITILQLKIFSQVTMTPGVCQFERIYSVGIWHALIDIFQVPQKVGWGLTALLTHIRSYRACPQKRFYQFYK